MDQSNRTMIKTMFAYFKPHSKSFSILTIGMFFSALITTIVPFMFGVLVDEVFYKKNVYLLPSFLTIFIITFIGENLLRFNEYKIWMYNYIRFMYRMKRIILYRILRYKAQLLNKSQKGDLVSVVMYDTDEIFHLINWTFNELLFHIIRFGFYFIWVSFINFQVALILFVSIPLSVFFSRYITNIIDRQSMKNRAEHGFFISWVIETTQGIREIKILSAENYIILRLLNRAKRLINLKIKENIINFIGERAASLISLLSTLTLFVVCTMFLWRNQLTLGEFVAIYTYFGSASWELTELSKASKIMQWRLSSIRRISDVLTSEVEDDINSSESKPKKIEGGDVHFNNVSFSYDAEKEVLHNLNLHIDSGQIIALIGKSGSGKSTVSNLLLKLYEDYSGEIKINNVDIKMLPNKLVRQSIGIVSQEIAIFNGTIRNNLTMGKNIPDEKIWEACNKAFISDVIHALPEGLDTIIGENNNDLSGGQKQRIAIARMFIKESNIIILDEATSSLDSEAESFIQKSLLELYKGKTVIIITHRTSVLQYTDKVAVIKDGAIVSYDHYSVLKEKCPYFTEIFDKSILKEKLS